jgi:hypothetical protein
MEKQELEEMEKLLEVLPDRDRVVKVERAKAQAKPSTEGRKHATAAVPPIASRDATYSASNKSSAPIPAALAEPRSGGQDATSSAYSQFSSTSSLFAQTPMYKDRPTSPRKATGPPSVHAAPVADPPASPRRQPTNPASVQQASSPRGGPSSSPNAARPISPRVAASSQSDSMDADILRLEKLKVMFEKDLITKEEYESRRRAILDEMMGLE